MSRDIKIIDDVIASLFDDYEQEQWIRLYRNRIRKVRKVEKWTK